MTFNLSYFILSLTLTNLTLSNFDHFHRKYFDIHNKFQSGIEDTLPKVDRERDYWYMSPDLLRPNYSRNPDQAE